MAAILDCCKLGILLPIAFRRFSIDDSELIGEKKVKTYAICSGSFNTVVGLR